MNNLQKLQTAFAEGLTIAIAEVTDTLSYQSIPEWDSMSHLFLIERLEEAFSIQIRTEDVLEMVTYVKVQQLLANYGVEFN